jgi:hypothetical protein
MKWSKNNAACGATWGALLVLDQSKEAFVDSPDVSIGNFPIWAKGESTNLRELRARSFATMLDNIFRDHEGARYENGVTRPQAIDAMKDVLIDDDKTINDLADVADDSYRFIEEDA